MAATHPESDEAEDHQVDDMPDLLPRTDGATQPPLDTPPEEAEQMESDEVTDVPAPLSQRQDFQSAAAAQPPLYTQPEAATQPRAASQPAARLYTQPEDRAATQPAAASQPPVASDEEPNGLLQIDATNGFNELGRKAML